MENSKSEKKYDLEERTEAFAKAVRQFVKLIKLPYVFDSDLDQLIRSSGSVGANYIEANESLGKKDFLMRIRISRKEAKEARYWLRLLDLENPALLRKRDEFVRESTELMNIFGSILRKSQ